MAPAEVRSQAGGDGQLVERLRAGGNSRLRRSLVRAGAPLGGGRGAARASNFLPGSGGYLLRLVPGAAPGQAYEKPSG